MCPESEVRCLVVDELGEPRWRPRGPAGADRRARRAVRAAAGAGLRRAGPAASDVLIHYYSSGTTGLPKAAVHTHEGVLWNSFGQIPDLGLGPDVRLPRRAVAVLGGRLPRPVLASVLDGAARVLMPTGGLTVERIVDASSASTPRTPCSCRRCCASSSPTRALWSGCAARRCAGSCPAPSPCRAPLIEQLVEELPDCRVCRATGCRSSPPSRRCSRPRRRSARRHRPDGRLITRPRGQADDGEIADAGAGELLLRSPATMSGYFGRPEETAEAFADGWLHTATSVEIDERGLPDDHRPQEGHDHLRRPERVPEGDRGRAPRCRASGGLRRRRTRRALGRGAVAVLVPREGESVDEDASSARAARALGLQAARGRC